MVNLKGVVLDPECYLAKNCTILGEATIEKGASIWPGAVIRADNDKIIVGEYSNIQDNAILHVYDNFPCIVGKYVTVGHGANVHACTIGDNCIIGMNACVMDGAVVGENSIIGAGAVVGKGKIIPPNSIVMGLPGKVKKEQTKEGIASNMVSATEYVKEAQAYVEAGIFVTGAEAKGVISTIAFKE